MVRNTAASLTLAVFIYPLSEDLGWSRTLIAGAASFGELAASGVSPLVGWLIDRYGTRLILGLSVFVLGLATISLSWATIPITFYLAYGVGRVIFASPVQIGSSVVVSRWFIRMRGRAIGTLFMSHSIGMIAFPLIASAVIAGRGWQDAWMLLGLLVWAIALLPVVLLMAERPEDVGLRPDGDPERSAVNTAGAPAAEESAWALKEAMRTPSLWILATATGSLFLVQAGVNTHLAAHLRDQGLNAVLAGAGLSLNAVFLGLGSIFWGWVVERFPARHVMAAVAVCIGGTAALFIVAGSTAEALVYSGLFGFAVGGILVVPPVAYANFFGRRSLGAIRGVTEPFTTLGQAIGALASGAAYDLTDSYSAAFIAFALLGAFTVVLVLFAKPPRRAGPAASGTSA